MEKIRNILNPGAKYDEEVLYGSGNSPDPVHSGSAGASSGAGSHLGSSSTNPTSATGHDSTPAPAAFTYESGNISSTSRVPGGVADDGASTTAIRHGVPGNSQSGSTLTGSSGTSDPLDTNKPLPQAPGSTGTGIGGASSTLGSGRDLPDRSVGQSGYGNTGADSLGPSTGRSFPLSGGSNTTGYGTGTGPTTGSAHQGSLGRDAAIGTGGVGAAGLAERELGGQHDTTSTGFGSATTLGSGAREPYGPESWQHQHVGHGHEYEGDPCDSGAPPALPHFTAGPHITDTANRLDPHVAGGPIEGTTGTGRHGHHHGHHETSTDAGVGSTGTGLDSSSRGYDDSRPSGTSGGIGSTGTGLGTGRSDDGTGVSGSTGLTSHHRDNTGKYDRLASGTPSEAHLGSTSSSSGYGSGTGIGPRGTDYDTQRGEHHLGQDAALAGGAGAVGAGPYEVSKDHPISTSGPAANTSGPHKYDMLNKLDPRVKETAMSSTTGTMPRDEVPTSGATGRDHHYGRDAGLVGAGGVAAYEAEKHHNKHEVPQQVTGGAGAVGAGAYEVSKDHPISTSGPAANTSGPHKYDMLNKLDPRVKETTMSSTTGTMPRDEVPTSGATGRDHHYGRDAGLLGAGGVAAYEAEKHHNKHEIPQQVTGHDSTVAGTQPAGYDQPPPVRGTGHHYGRDAGLVGAGGAAAYEGEKHLGHDRTGTSSYPEDRHAGRDTPLAGGAGAAGGAEFSKKEAEKRAEKEQKAIAKEEKREEKAEHKHQKSLRKEHEKEDKAIHKEHSKEEKHDGKKHGLFGFLHREKPDPELKEEEAARQARLHGHAGNVSTVAGVAVAEDEHGHHKLHKDPPPGYAPAPESGYASQVTGGTGTTALAQGESVQRGSHISGVGNKLDPNVADRGDTVDDSVFGYQGQGSTGSGLGGYGETAGTGHGEHGVQGDHAYNAAGEAAHRLHHDRQPDVGLGPEKLEPGHGGTSGFDSTMAHPSTGLGSGTTGSHSGRH
ncbi:hypothetical protein LPUS_12406 [Lasallia pustulata]|uniref:Uncharacterized protein n=1 Tax=Lasallia pustulata TaxID=136370 RepID=A0A1W5DE11_9LECA|nr:hypothetical protein LPUS_12406 [Lasallia pustulata]